jgi:hypothetical protein
VNLPLAKSLLSTHIGGKLNHGQGIFMTMQASAYFDTDAYHLAIDKLEAIARTFDPAAPDMVRSAIIQVLGEELGIWPLECLKGRELQTLRLVA